MLFACIVRADALALLANSLCISSTRSLAPPPARSHAKCIPREYTCVSSNLIPTALYQSLPAGNPDCTSTDHTTPSQLFPSSSSPNKPRHQSYHSHFTYPCPHHRLFQNEKRRTCDRPCSRNTDTRAARVPKGFGTPLTQGHQ